VQKIKQLSMYEAQKIAAGEVVERPANIVKELVENSIDAHAHSISVYIKDGGKSLIKIVDNGCGMSELDAHMSIKHHATSKMESVNDLSTLTTFGFRGEALSSISSVSKITIITKEKDSPHGIQLAIENNEVTQDTITSCNTGTTIHIEDIFYNVPARRKFLKGTQTEWRAIVQLMHAFCLDYTYIHFKVYHQDKCVLNCPPADSLIDRLKQLYDVGFNKHIIPVNHSIKTSNLSVTGAITDTHFYRYDRNQIFLFVNNRWVKNFKLSQALVKGYQGVLQPQKYPAGFLFINLDSEHVDINIHPRKEEVQFTHPRIVTTCIKEAVEKSLNEFHTEQLSQQPAQDHDQYMHDHQRNMPQPAPEYPEHREQSHIHHIPQNDTQDSRPQGSYGTLSHYMNTSQTQEHAPQSDVEQFKHILAHAFTDSDNDTRLHEKQEPIHHTSEEQPTESYRIVGQLFKTYIIIQTEEALVMIDQHAADERIIYERLKSRFEDIETIQLMFPETINMNSQDLDICMQYQDILERSGIYIQQMTDHEMIITHAPVIFKKESLSELIKLIISWHYSAGSVDASSVKKKVRDNIHTQMSCKMAVKAGDILSDHSIKHLISTLYKTDNKLTCPHGRPTLWTISQKDIEKKFKRDYRS
jgi:DNA mismatch repair protein MutL